MGKLFANLQFNCLVTIAQKTVVPDFHKATRKDVNKKSTYKFIGGNRHHLMFIGILVVTPFEGNRIIINANDTFI